LFCLYGRFREQLHGGHTVKGKSIRNLDHPTQLAPMPGPEAKVPTTRFRWRWLLYLGAAVLFLGAAKYFQVQELLLQALDWVRKLGPWGPVIFVGVYIVATVLLIPGSVLTLGAGAVFGLVPGTLLVSVASTLAATSAFLLGRYCARAAVARRIEQNERFTAIDRAVAAEGWKIVFLTRLSPVFPYTLLNYAFGLTQVKLGHYILASWIGMLPPTVLVVYLGSLANVSATQRVQTAGEWTLYAVGFLSTLGVTILVTRIARRALARTVGD
jgi:uncharacterized membrane protein YdjX (TVP38/TMEM64 family)